MLMLYQPILLHIENGLCSWKNVVLGIHTMDVILSLVSFVQQMQVGSLFQLRAKLEIFSKTMPAKVSSDFL